MKLFFITVLCTVASMHYSFSQQNTATAVQEKQIERYQEEAERKKQEYIADFLATLTIDDFQKEIVSQAMDTYFVELFKINKLKLQRFERVTQVEALDQRHFKDVKAIVTEDEMAKIMDAIKGKWEQEDDKKKKKRKRKNKN